jgi:UDP-N-acetylmuramoylalanine--D-glutamate ligase
MAEPAYTRVLPRPAIPEGDYLVIGLARSGQAAAKLLTSRGFKVYGADTGSPKGVETLGDFAVNAHVESDGVELLNYVETVIKSPGVPNEAPAIVAARAAGKTVIGELELGWRMTTNPFVAVTGTNGKTTTTELLGAIYREAGLPVAVAGNVGTPVCELVATVDPEATFICEASSFQLEDAPTFTPECAILLNLQPDHIDRHGTFENYRDAKLSMFARQTGGQFAIAGPDVDFELPGDGMKFKVKSAGFNNQGGKIAMRGAHNIGNALTAAHAALLMGVDPLAIDRTLSTFKGVEHRMEPAGEVSGVTYINDSKATNVAAALAALESYDGDAHAILGGSLKGETFEGLKQAVNKACVAVYLNGDAAPQMAEDLAGINPPIHIFATLKEAFGAAAAAATAGQTVLLTPACASFDQFDNYEQRGEVFKQLVSSLSA